MSVYYSLAIQAEKKKEFLLKRAIPLTQEETSRLQSRACFDLLKGKAPKEMLSFDELDGKLSEMSIDSEKAVYLQRIQLPGLSRPITLRRSYCTFWKELICTTPSYIPLVNVIWILFITPFLALYHFYIQSRALNAQWESYLGRLQLSSYENYLNALSDFTRLIPEEQSWLKVGLTEAFERGKSIANTGKCDALYGLATQYSDAILQREQPFILPIGVPNQKGFTPLFLVVTKQEGLIRFDVNAWGSHQTLPLERTYYLKQEGDQMQEKLKETLFTLMLPVISKEESVKPSLGNCCAHMRMHNLKHFQDASQAGSSGPAIKTVTEGARLHERLLLSGLEPSREQQPVAKGKLLPSFIEGCLPGLNSASKIMLYLSLFQEGVAIYKEAFDSLSALQQQEGFNLLENTLVKLKLHASKFLKKKEEIEAFEAAFQTTFDQLKAFRGHKKPHSTSSTVCKTKTKVTHFQELRAKKSEETSVLVSTEITELADVPPFDGIRTQADLEVAITAVTKSNEAIDQLIGRKEYARARMLAFELMRRLPVAKVGAIGLFALFQGKAMDRLSEQAALVAKHFWESSLRLNIKTLEPPAVFQMIKLQALIVKLMRISPASPLNGMTLDMDEIRHLLFFHPHQRWGMHPDEEREWLPLIHYLYSDENQGESTRFDTMIHNTPTAWTHHVDFLKDNPVFKPIRRSGKEEELPDPLIDLRRVQMMMTCLLKPDYCLSKHYNAGKLGQVTGLLWLDGMQEQAKKEGATPEEMPQKVLEIKLRDVGKELSSMKRLELATDDFVTEVGPIIKIVNDGFFSGSGVAYLPTGFGLPYAMEARYATHLSEENSEELAGQPAETHQFLTDLDHRPVIHDNSRPFTGGKRRFTGLSEVEGFTERSHLLMQLQEEPREQISQLQRTLLSTLKVNDQFFNGSTYDTLGVAPTSTFEALNLIGKQPHLLLIVPARQTLELALSAPFALQRALRENPHFFQTYSHTLKQLIERYWPDDELLCALLHLSQTIHDHMIFAAQIEGTDPYACFTTKALPSTAELIAIANSYLTLTSPYKGRVILEWLKERMRATESNKGALSFVFIEYVRHVYKTGGCLSEEIPVILFAASLFKNSAAQFEMPQLTAHGIEWIEKIFKTELKAVLASLIKRKEILNALTALIYQDYTFSGEWVEVNGSFSAGPYIFTPNSLELQSTGHAPSLLQGLIPKGLKSHPALLQLFGSQPIYAAVKRGKKNGVYHYTFEKAKAQYHIEHDTSAGEVIVFRLIDGTWARWFYDENTLTFSSHSALDQLIEKNGLWIDVENRKGWIFTHLPQAKDKGRLLTCKMTQEGELTMIQDLETGKYLLTQYEDKENFQREVPFWPPQHVLAFGDAIGKAPTLFYVPATGDLLKGKQLTTKIFDGDVELLQELSPEPFAKRFLDTLGILGSCIATAVKDSKGVFKFIIHPYPLQREKGSFSPVRVSADAALLHLSTPLLIGFDLGGKVEGSPSAFLYLAYVYAHLKDYARSYYYLEKAQRAPRISAKEIQEFDRISTLIHTMPSYSLQGARFVLKAALTIHAVRRTHFGEMLYQNELSGTYFREVQFLTDTYRAYKKRVKEREIAKSSEEEMQALTSSDIEMLESFEATSLREFSDVYKPKHADELTRKIDPPAELTLSQIDPAALKSPPAIVLQSLVAFTKCDAVVPFNEVPHGFAPSAETLICDFLSLMSATQSPQKKALAQYLLSKAEWEITPPITSQEKELALVGEYLRQYLLLQFRKLPIDHLILRAMEGLQKIRALVPVFPRPKMAPFSMLFTLLDVVLTGRSFMVNRAIAILSDILVQILPTEKMDPRELFSASLEIEKDKLEQSKSGHITTAGTMLDYMKTQDNPNYLPLEVTVVRGLLEKEEADHKDMNKEFTLFGVVEESQGRGYPLMGMRVFVENLKKIYQLENALVTPLPQPQEKAKQPFASTSYALLIQPLKTLIEEMARPTTQEQAEFEKRKVKLESAVATARRYFPLEKERIEAEENQQLQKGLDEARVELLKELSERRLFSKTEKEQFQVKLAAQKNKIEEELLKERSELIIAIHELPELQRMVKAPDLYSEDELLERALHLYKRGRFAGGPLDSQMTQWLLLKTALQQIEKAQQCPEMEKAIQILFALFDPARYFLSSLHRKCLVAESLDRVILRPKQREALVKIDKDPSCWSSVRMGIGKTSYIMPIIADLLAQKGYFPILTVPSRLLARNRDSIGSATRRFFGQEDLEFLMPTQQDLSHSTLSEKYLHLLRVKAAGGYIVTSPEHLACLNEQITLHIREVLNQPDDTIKLLTLLFKIHYLQKIAQLIYGESRAGKSFFFGDEIDDTHHISNQINLAVGKKIKISMTIRETVKSFFELLIASTHPATSTLRQALSSGAQAAILETERDAALSALALEMKNSAFLREKLQDLYRLIENTSDREWCAYLLGESEKLPSIWPELEDADDASPAFFELLGTLKMIFAVNAKQLFSLQPGNDIGFSNYQGYIAVPKQQKNEIQGMRHGNEYELVFIQYLCYYQMFYSLGTTDETLRFLKEELKKMRYEDPTAYGKLKSDAAKVKESDLLAFLLRQEAYPHRFVILERVFDQGYISRYSEQIEMSVQDLYQGTQVGGVSGTLDPYTLPYISDQVLFSERSGSTRQVEAETLLRLSMGHKEGLDTPLKLGSGIYEDTRASDYLAALLESPSTKAIINASGVTAEGKDTLQWICDLRKMQPHRSYLFIHPKEQLAYLWTSDQQEPAFLRDRTIPENCICIYAPSDTRGTDLPIGEGDVHLFLGPATSLQDMMQAIYRARQLGSTHTVFLHIAQQMAQLIPLSSKETRTITFGAVFNYIKLRTLQTKQSLNLKAQVRRIKGQFKGALLRYQRMPLAVLDDPANYDMAKLPLIAPQVVGRAQAFDTIQKFLVKSKKTDLIQAYTPQPKGKGVDRVQAAFIETYKQVETLREQLKANVMHAPSELAFIKSLKNLMEGIKEQESYFSKSSHKHLPYLPTRVDIPPLGSDDSEGDQEQVIELQQEQILTKTNEVQKAPVMNAKMTDCSLHNVFETSNLNTTMNDPCQLPLLFSSPTTPIYISLEARKIHDPVPVFTDPLFYIAIKNETVALICHFDYQQFFVSKVPFEGQIFALSHEGLREIYSNAPTPPATPQMNFKKLLARFFIGDISFTPEERAIFLETFPTLSAQERQTLHLFATSRGDHFLRTFGKEALSQLL